MKKTQKILKKKEEINIMSLAKCRKCKNYNHEYKDIYNNLRIVCEIIKPGRFFPIVKNGIINGCEKE